MNLLQQILRDKRADIETAKKKWSTKDLQRKIRDTDRARGFRQALTDGGFGIIAEIKRKSPSMSDMIPGNVEEAPEAYRASQIVKAVSVLTDGKYFGMAIEDLEKYRRRIGKPILRKDFMLDEYQVWEARAFGADAILLMASVLNKSRLRALFELATHLGMDVLFECHSEREIDIIPQKAKIYGINSRQFKANHRSLRYRASRLVGRLKLFEFFGVRDFSTDMDLFKDLIEHLPKGVVKVAESGVKPSRIAEVRDLGFDCALIGTALLKSQIGVTRTLNLFLEALEGKVIREDVVAPAPGVASA